MKVDFDNPPNILRRGRKLSEAVKIPELEEALRLLKIYTSYANTTEEQVGTIFEMVELQAKIISLADRPQQKLWQFKTACMSIGETFYLTAKSSKESFKASSAEKSGAVLQKLFQALENLITDGYSFLKSFQFRKTLEEKFGNKALLKFLREESEKKYDRFYNQLYQEDKVFEQIEKLVDKVYAQVHGQLYASNIQSVKDMVPFVEYTEQDAQRGTQFDQTLYFSMTEEVRDKKRQGKPAFVRYLVENYEIQINGNFILKISDEEVDLYYKQIFEFFFRKTFFDPLEKELVKFIQKIIIEEKWL